MTGAAAPLATAEEDDASFTECDATFEGADSGGGSGMLTRLDEDADADEERFEGRPLWCWTNGFADVAAAAAAADDDNDEDVEEEEE